MRQYPRMVYKKGEDNLIVNTEHEEIEAGENGYEAHFDPEINKAREGTEKGILRGEKPVIVAETTTATTGILPPKETNKPKRKRRTKAEIKAAK